LYSNEKFSNDILHPLLSISDDVADTSELFLRSYQLITLSEKNITRSELKNKEVSKLGIGKFVQVQFKKLIEENKLSDDIISNLLDSKYSKRKLNISYPILKELKTDSNISEERKVNGYDRYYAKPIIGKYLLCNNWYEHHRDDFMKWLESINNE